MVLGTETRRYALFGALFGLCFPVGATLFMILQEGLSFGFSSMIWVQRNTPLLWIIDSAPFFLGLFASFAGVRQDRLAAVLDRREEVIRERTRELALANQAVKELLDNMQQAIFTVGSQGKVNPEYSAYTATLFGDVTIDGAHILDLLQVSGEAPGEAALRMKNWFELVFGSDELQWMMTRDEAISAIEYRRPEAQGEPNLRNLELEYAPIYTDGVVSRVMVIAKDVTDLRELRRDVVDREQKLNMVTEVVTAGESAFLEFMSEAEERLRPLREPKREGAEGHNKREVMRGVHTIKGNARMCGLRVIEAVAHEVEQGLVSGKGAGSDEDLLAPLTRALADARAAGEKVFSGARTAAGHREGPSRARVLVLERCFGSFSRNMARALPGMEPDARAALASLEAAVESVGAVETGTLEPALQRMVADLAMVRDKRVGLRVSGGQVTVSHLTRSALREILVHALRNAVDHGVEQVEAREAAGKPPGSQVAVAFMEAEKVLITTVRDDGAGIDVAALKAACVEAGLISADAARALQGPEALELVFRPGLSTASEVTAISGRGAGMDIIRGTARCHGGEVTLSSTPGKGTEITIRLPRSSYPLDLPAQRRKAPRREVYYYLMLRHLDGDEFGRLIDASALGLRAAHKDAVEVGETLTLAVHGPEELDDRRAINVRASCRWSRRAPSGKGYLSGFSFEELAQDDLAVLHDWTQALGVDGKGLIPRQD